MDNEEKVEISSEETTPEVEIPVETSTEPTPA